MSIDEVVALVPEIKQQLDRIESLVSPATLTVPEVCARYLRRSVRWATDRPWCLPNYGESEIPGKPRAWSVRTCEEWYSVPIATRRAEWFRQGRTA